MSPLACYSRSPQSHTLQTDSVNALVFSLLFLPLSLSHTQSFGFLGNCVYPVHLVHLAVCPISINLPSVYPAPREAPVCVYVCVCVTDACVFNYSCVYVCGKSSVWGVCVWSSHPPFHKLIKYQINVHQFPPAPVTQHTIIISDLSGWLAGIRPIHQLCSTADGPGDCHFLPRAQLDSGGEVTPARIVWLRLSTLRSRRGFSKWLLGD